MSVVSVAVTAIPEHVRTLRLVAVAVARRAGVEEALLDEIRLAVGEGAGRAMRLHRQHVPALPVRIEIDDEGPQGTRLVVRVHDQGPPGVAVPTADQDGSLTSADRLVGTDVAAASYDPDDDAEDVGSLPAGTEIAVLVGLVDDLAVDPHEQGPGTVVQLAWPRRATPPGGLPAF